MKLKKLLTGICALVMLTGCRQADDAKSPDEIVARLRQSGKLYVTEYVVHKLITANDLNRYSGTIAGKRFSIDLSIGERKIAIPIDAHLKAYVDFDCVGAENISVSGDPAMLTLTLPQPKVELTSSKIDHKGIKVYKGIFRSDFSDAEMSQLEEQGRELILASVPEFGIVATAKKNAVDVLLPILMEAGFDPSRIVINFNDSDVK